MYMITGRAGCDKVRHGERQDGYSRCSSISTGYIERVLERLKANKHRKSTKHNYHQIWKHFNDFVLRLDIRPKTWERHVALFCAYLVDKGNKSATIKSYVSAIKSILTTDGYEWNDSMILMETIVEACKIQNDRIFHRFPIHIGLLEMLLFEVQRTYKNDFYLEILFKTIFIIGYHGLLRVSEMATEKGLHCMNHAVKAKDVHIDQNKQKILLILYSSKTLGKESRLQKIKIEALDRHKHIQMSRVDGNIKQKRRHFCSFNLLHQYLTLRSPWEDEDEPLFILHHGVVLTPSLIRKNLKIGIKNIGLDASLYDIHSLRVGRTTDMIKMGSETGWQMEI